jgi:two-component system, chemotaxis family, protein-glutamate methylesterase/glutaminase
VPENTLPRVVVADDSSFMRRLLHSALGESGFEVVGTAEDGTEALALCEVLKPDAMTLDLAMPGVHGLDVLRSLKRSGTQLPVVVVSAFSPAFGATAIDALSEGAFELVAKPAPGETIDGFLADLREKVQAAVRSGRGRLSRRVADFKPPAPIRRTQSGTSRAVVIACSTGGPRALADLVPKLPAPLGRGALIVQHMPAGFTGSLAQRLNGLSELQVREAADGERVDASTAFLAPGGSHLRIADGGTVRISAEAPVGGLRPRADLTIDDAARVYGDRLLLVVLTGMGKDGLAGAQEVKRRGGRILAEAESSCTVYGMPRAIVEAKLADDVLDLSELAEAIAVEAGK